MIACQKISLDKPLTRDDVREAVHTGLSKTGPAEKILMIPPDITRYASGAGLVARDCHEYYGKSIRKILIASGTHAGMSAGELKTMYEGIPAGLFENHDFRVGTLTLGTIEKEYIEKITGSRLSFDFPVQVAGDVANGPYDRIVSLGQIVPHEVAGMSGHVKNILVGTGGPETINKSHFIGAVTGMENIMGRISNPVRDLFNLAASRFLINLPITYILTVNGTRSNGIHGIFIGDGEDLYRAAGELSAKLNITRLDRRPRKVVVHLDPKEYKSTWLGNKSIYRTRMAIDTGGILVVMAPGVRTFGEDKTIDKLIRKYGYAGTEKVLKDTGPDTDLGRNLSAAAHLIHGSTEGRFEVIYCTDLMREDEIESVHYRYGNVQKTLERYSPETLSDGFNTMRDGEEIYYVSHPGQGLWSYKENFT